jgi:hypothetical protein
VDTGIEVLVEGVLKVSGDDNIYADFSQDTIFMDSGCFNFRLDRTNYESRIQQLAIDYDDDDDDETELLRNCAGDDITESLSDIVIQLAGRALGRRCCKVVSLEVPPEKVDTLHITYDYCLKK